MKTDTALWQAINAYDLDDAEAALPFSQRLARDMGWTTTFAQRAVADYKRFIYLVCVAGHSLTPSDVIDEVWHLHLLYTEDYWDRFCGRTLMRRIHHGPTKGGAEERGRYHDAYEATLWLYEQEFGTPPPRDLWPEPGIRFAGPRFGIIDTSTHIRLPKRQVFLCLAILAPLLLAACSAQQAADFTRHHTLVVLFGVLIGWVVIRAFLFPPKPGRRGKGGKDGGGCGSSCGGGGGHGGGHGCGSGCGSGCGGGCGGGCGS